MKKSMKWISVCLAAVLLLATVPAMGLAAAGQPAFVVDEVSGNPGDTVTVKVSTRDNPGIVGLRIKVSYDTAVLELKNPFQRKDIVSVVEIIRQEGWLKHTVFISFDLGNMIHLRKLLPEQPLQYLVKELTEEAKANLVKYALDLDIKYSNLSADQVEALHGLGRKVNVWTVDDPKIAVLLVQMGVDYITTNILE